MKTATSIAAISVAAVLAAMVTHHVHRSAVAGEPLAVTGRDAVASGRSPGQVAMMWVDAYNRHDPDAAAALYDENVTNVQLPYGKPVQGREAMRDTYVKVFQAFPDIHVEVENLLEDGPWVAVEWQFHGTMRGEFAGHPPNNSEFKMRGCEVFQVVDGKIHVQRGYWDKETMFSQLGIKSNR